jgi:hypothetical protein
MAEGRLKVVSTLFWRRVCQNFPPQRFGMALLAGQAVTVLDEL